MAAEVWQVEVVDDPGEFAARGGPWLVAHAVDANVIGSALAATIAAGATARSAAVTTTPDPPTTEPAPPQPAGEPAAGPVAAEWLLVVGHGGEVTGAAMVRAGYEVFLPELPAGAAVRVAETLHERGAQLPGATGDPGAVHEFCQAWQRLTGQHWEEASKSRVYVLDAPAPPVGVPGAARSATAVDLELVVRWAQAFFDDGHGSLPGAGIDQRPIATARVTAGEVSLWAVDGEAVSMAAVSPTVGGITRVNLVYTPPAKRGRGYGAAVSAAVTQRALSEGANSCMLYADLANPTSNGIYRRIGYREFGESLYVRFT